MAGVRWLDRPEDHDYPAAASYLALLAAPAEVEQWMAALRTAEPNTFKAKDILRAGGWRCCRSTTPMWPRT